MKTLQLITGLGPGGAEQVVFDLATRLDRDRYPTAVCSILDPTGRQGLFAERLRDAGVEVFSLGLTHKCQFRRALRLKQVLQERRPDVLHAHLFHANVLAAGPATGLGCRISSRPFTSPSAGGGRGGSGSNGRPTPSDR